MFSTFSPECTKSFEHLSNFTMTEDASRFRNRQLKDPEAWLQHNAWDDVQWDEEQESAARKKVADNSRVLMTGDELANYESNAAGFWDTFYSTHQRDFFKDRHWLFTEFQELLNVSKHVNTTNGGLKNTETRFNVFEIGCGVGNTIFPILDMNIDPNLYVYGCDFSEKAISLLKNHPKYDIHRCHTFVLDATCDPWTVPFQESSIDVIILIFTLSAINPQKMEIVMSQAAKYLKPGGLVLFRDYGRYDMAQLRFKPGRALGEHFYVRGDGTRAYFFTGEEIDTMFKKVGLEKLELIVDRRLQVNRGKQLKMYRVWIQAKYQKVKSNKLMIIN